MESFAPSRIGYNHQPMKRLLLLLILLLAVPLQSSWAAAGGYCEYERGGAASHFGHHSEHHQHGQADGSKGGAAGKLHHDCSHHTGGLGVVPAGEAVLAGVTRTFRESGPLLSTASPPALRPERPKWSSPAL